MILIQAEGYARSGQAGVGKQMLENFVRTYRDPAYSADASGRSLVDEIWYQRRIELWGEGFSYADMMRLKKDMDRRGGGFEAHTTYFIPTGSDALILPIPQDEIEANAMLTEADNNPTASAPDPVTE